MLRRLVVPCWCVLMALGGAGATLAATFTWVGPDEGTWGTPGNWSPPGVPGAGDTALVPSGSTFRILLDANVELGALSLGDPMGGAGEQTLDLDGRSLTLDGASSVGPSGVLELSSGGGALRGGATVEVLGRLDWSAGSMLDAGTTLVRPDGELRITGSSGKSLSGGRQLVIEGTASWSGTGSLAADAAATLLRVAPGGLLDLQSDALFDDACCAGIAKLRVEGTLRKSAGAAPGMGSPSSIEVEPELLGTVEVQQGHLQLTRAGTLGGGASIAAGARLSAVTGTLVLADGLAVTGDPFLCAGATLSAEGMASFERLDLQSGNLEGGGTVVVSEAMSWSGGTQRGTGTTSIPVGASLSIGGASSKGLSGGRQLLLAGDGSWGGTGGLSADDAATLLHVMMGSTFMIDSVAAIFDDACCAGVPRLQVDGTLRKSALSTGRIQVEAELTQAGAVEVLGGELSLTSGGSSWSGSCAIADGAFLSFTSAAHHLAAGASFAGAGRVELSGGDLFVDGAVSMAELRHSGGNLRGTGTLAVSRLLDWRGGTERDAGTTSIPDGALLELSQSFGKSLLEGRQLLLGGDGSWSGTGSLASDDAATLFHVQSGGRFELGSDASMADNCCAGKPVLRVDGELVKVAPSSGTSTLAAALDNHGTVRVEAGRLLLTGAGTSDGDWNALPDTTIEWAGGTHELGEGTALGGAGLFRISGATVPVAGASSVQALELASGVLEGDGPLSVTGSLRWTGGTMQGGGSTTVEAAATLELSGATRILRGGRLLELKGQGAWTDNTRTDLDDEGTIFRVAAGGLLELQGDATLDDACCGGLGLFQLDGTLRKSMGGGGASAIDVPVALDGTVEVQAGELRVQEGGGATGDFAIAEGALLTFDGGGFGFDGVSGVGLGFTRIAGTADVTVPVGAEFERLELDSGGDRLGAGTIAVSGLFRWLGGHLGDPGATIVGASGMLELASSVAKRIDSGHRLLLDGTGSMAGTGRLELDGPDTLVELRPGAVFELVSDADLLDGCCEDPATFRNAGTLRKTFGSAGDSSRVDSLFENLGSLELQAGRMEQRRGGLWSGSTVIADGASLAFAQGATHAAVSGAAFTGAGFVEVFGSADLSASGDVDFEELHLGAGGDLGNEGLVRVSRRFEFGGGTLSGGGTTRILAPATAELSSTGSKRVDGGQQLELAGLTSWIDAGSWQLDGESTRVHVLPGGLLEQQGAGDFVDGCCQGEAAILNEGTWRLTGGAVGDGRSYALPFFNDGLVEVQVGELLLSGGGGGAGDWTVAADADLAFTGDSFVLTGGSFGGAAPARVASSGELRVDGPVSAERLQQDAGLVSGSGLLSVSTSLDWNGGEQTGIGTTRLLPGSSSLVGGGSTHSLTGGRTLDVQGELTHSSSANLNLDSEGTLLRVAPGGSYTMLSDADFGEACCDPGNGTLLVEGLLSKSGEQGNESFVRPETTIAGGTLAVLAGTLRFGAPLVQTGGTTRVAGGTLDVDSGLALQGGELVGTGPVLGDVANTGGTLSPGASPGIFAVQGGYLQGPGGRLSVEATGTVPGSEHDRLAVTGTATVGGRVELSLPGPYDPAIGDALGLVSASTFGAASPTLAFPPLPGRQAALAIEDGELLLRFLPAGPPVLGSAEILNDPTAGAAEVQLRVAAHSSGLGVAQAEVLLDAEPPGEERSLPFTAPGASVDELLLVDVSGLAPGPHLLRVRVADANGLHSPSAALPFTVSAGALPVVLVPGYDLSVGGPHPEQVESWRQWLESLGVPVAVAMVDSWAAPGGGAGVIAASAQDLLAGSGEARLDLVAFDQGAQPARIYAEGPGSGLIRRLVLVAGPHLGSDLADDLLAALQDAAADGHQASIVRLAADRALRARTRQGAALFNAAHRRPAELAGIELRLIAAVRPTGPNAGTDDIIDLDSALGLSGPNVLTRVFMSASAPAPLHRRLLDLPAFFAQRLAPALGLDAAGLGSAASAGTGARIGLARPLVRLSTELEEGPGGKWTGTAEVDESDSVSIEALAADGDVDVTATSPSGKVYDEGSARGDSEASGGGWEGEGELAASQVTVTDPEPGTWTVEVETSGSLPPVGKFSQAGAIQPVVAVEPPIADPGDSVLVRLDLGTSEALVSSASTVLTGPEGQSLVAQLFDDGAGPDAVMGDGMLSASLELPAEDSAGGRWRVEAEAQGTIDGTAFDRGAAAEFDVTTGSVVPTGGFSDSLADADADGTSDQLTVETTLQVARAGSYAVAGELDAPSGKFATDASATLSGLDVGEEPLLLSFASTAFSREGESGAYELGKLTILEESPGQGVAFHASSLHVTQEVAAASVEQDGRPLFAFLAPTAPTALLRDAATLRWSDSDPDDDARITLFLDDDDEGFDGTEIPGASELSEDDETDAFVVDLSALEEGDWHVHARIEDDETVRQVYAGGVIRVGLDSDGDGVPDSTEIELGTDPLSDDLGADDDGDGLSNGDEIGRGTLPEDPDSDDGGEGDGREIAAGRDPLAPEDDVDTRGLVPGDVDASGGPPNVNDVLQLLRIAVQLDLPSAIARVLGDLSPSVLLDGSATPILRLRIGDLVIDVGDVLAALRVAVGLDLMQEPPPG